MIAILDFGSQYTQLIARRIREQQVYCEIHPCTISLDKIKAMNPKGIILSGGPCSVTDEDAPLIDPETFGWGIPILGICYGLQLMVQTLGGTVEKALHSEYGRAELTIIEEEPLFSYFGTDSPTTVWMSHGDRVIEIPENFEVIGTSENSPFAAIVNKEKNFFGIQFHPEVYHTDKGNQLLRNFLFEVCSEDANWTMDSFLEKKIKELREEIGDQKVLCALSGGVDSSVTALLLHEAIGENLTCMFVDNGLLRKGEAEKVVQMFREHYHMKLIHVDAGDIFLGKLAGVSDPEKKRKIIGNEFIYLFERETEKLEDDFTLLAQGTLYPDVIESVSFKGPSVTIKSHHNVGGLPETMKMSLVEPLRELFKDEVRLLGKALKMGDDFVHRQPFPGPGLAVRILGAVDPQRVEVLQNADAIVLEEIKKAGLYRDIWQSFAVLLPVKSVGVMGDVRTYEWTIAVRSVDSADAMTADWTKLPYELLGKISNRIINEVPKVNRVVYDITSKPPGTIEWE
ncbi:MAG: GMP synthase (glutamine-hydrolyzing) [bacterium]|jgi:GMP synthase (glutamine-hydrolysing)